MINVSSFISKRKIGAKECEIEGVFKSSECYTPGGMSEKVCRVYMDRSI